MNNANKKEKERTHIILSILYIISLVTFITPAHAAVGDMILDIETILFHGSEFNNTENAVENSTLLKEGYSISLDRMNSDYTVAGFTIYKDEEIVKRIKVNNGDYFYYNKTIGGREYTIIESKVSIISIGTFGSYLVVLKPVRQYSDGSVEPDFITASLNPYTNETPPEEWNRTFGRVYNNLGRYGHSFQQTSDGGYILIGSKNMYTIGMSPSEFLIKTDTNGNEQWNRTFEDIGLINAYSVWQTSDGGYIFGGTVRSYRNLRWENDVRLVKTDSYGNIVWHKTMVELGTDYVMSVAQSPDGGYILAGFSRIWDKDYAWLIKTDANGNEQWNETFAVPRPNKACYVWQTADGGGTNLYYAGGTDAWVIKTDVNGKQEWNKTFDSDCFDKVYSIEQTLDDGYILSGSKGSNACLVKTDANGSEQWNRTIGSGLIARISSIRQAPDGGYVLAGKIDTARNPEIQGHILYSNDDAWLFKIDASGNLKWSKTFGGLRNDEARLVQQTSDGSYIIAGTTESYGTGGRDLWLVKVGGMEVDAAQSGARLSDDNFTENLQGGIPAEPEGGNAPTDGEPVQTPDIPGFGAVVAVMGLLVWVCLSRRRS
jgi:PGF-CTERM protein